MEQELELEKLIGAWSCLEKDFPNKNNPLSCLRDWSPKSLGKAPWQEALIAICCERKSSFRARTTERVRESRKHVKTVWWHVKTLCFAAHTTVERAVSRSTFSIIVRASYRSSQYSLNKHVDAGCLHCAADALPRSHHGVFLACGERQTRIRRLWGGRFIDIALHFLFTVATTRQLAQFATHRDQVFPPLWPFKTIPRFLISRDVAFFCGGV